MTVRRVLLPLGLIGLLSTCSEPTSSGALMGFGRVAVRAVAPPSLSRFAPSLVLEQVKAVVGRNNSQAETFTVLDSTIVPFNDNQNSVATNLRLFLQDAETLEVRLDYQTSDGTLLFVASQQVIVRPGATVSTPALQPFYVGPGFNIAFMSLSPFDSVLSAGDALTFDPTPTDANQQPVAQFYVSWATDDPRIPIDARGRIVAPNVTKLLNITASTPNGTVATTTVGILGSAALGITPDSVEKLPNGTQLFQVTVGALRTSQFIWSVNGVDGGSAEFGTIDSQGFYIAPATTPNPSKFKVCARDAAAPALREGCAVVVIKAVPSVGADLVVINDQNIFDGTAMDSSPGNRQFVRNIITFSGSGPRASQKGVLYDRGRNSPCLANGECSDTANGPIDGVIKAAGYTIAKQDFYTQLTSIPANVKVIFLWMPLIFYQESEVNVLKRFAAEGGRIVFIGERVGFYTDTGISVENQLLLNMGSQMTNLANEFDCGFYFETPAASLRPNPLLQGISSLLYACAAEIQAGPNDFPLFYDVTNTHLLAAVTKVDVTPIQNTRQQAMPLAGRRPALPVTGARGIGGTNR
jgi:hypothetical protein